METKPDDFRIMPLRCDRDALVLILAGSLLAALTLIGLAFLPDAAWDRLKERSELLWGALVAIAPIAFASWQRMSIRKEAVKAMGKAASAPLSIEAAPMMYETNMPAAESDTDGQDS